MFTDWDHNAWYHRLLLRQVPTGAQRVLEVGCGAGALLARLATRVPHVDGVDRSADMLEAAARRVPENVTLHGVDVLAVDLPAGSYDAVLSLSVLHHLRLEEALWRMASWLRPGGVLAAVAVPRLDLRRELPVELAAVTTHHGLGLVFRASGVLLGRAAFPREAVHHRMPVTDPVLTTRQVRERAAAVLPGVRVRRLLFWRYLLAWTKES